MLLVVIGHITLSNIPNDTSTPVATKIQALIYGFHMPLLMSISGILFSLSLCLNIAKICPSLFKSFRDYTFQIFLMGIFFQMAVCYVYGYFGIEALYWPLYFVSILVGVYIPVLIAKSIQKLNNKYLSMCFGL